MLKKIREFIIREHLLETGETVTIAVSGGADSVCLFFLCLQLASEYDLKLHVMHVEHGIRGEASREDAQFVEALCQEHGVPCQVIPVDVLAYAKQQGKSLEEAARELRYDMLFSQAKGKIALAHHMSDQVETVLMHLLRGTGVKGLTGMHPKTYMEGHTLIRPLLETTREEIEAYLKQHKQDYCMDETNEDRYYTRNRIRHELLPILKEINPKAIDHIYHTSTILRNMWVELDDFIREILYDVSMANEIKKDSLLKYPLSVRKEVIHQWLIRQMKGAKDVSYHHVESVEKLLLASERKRIQLPQRYEVISLQKTIRLVLPGEQRRENDPLTQKKQEIPMLFLGQSLQTTWANLRFTFSLFGSGEGQPPKETFSKWIDYDKIQEPLVIRTRESGDYIYIKGNHKKRLSRFFIDEKRSMKERRNTLLLCSGKHVLWIVGDRISEEVKVTETTERILSIEASLIV